MLDCSKGPEIIALSGKTDQRTSTTSQPWLQSLLDAVTDQVICGLDMDGLILNWNAGAVRLTGYSSAEVLGRSYALLFDAEDRRHGAPRRFLESAGAAGRATAEHWIQ